MARKAPRSLRDVTQDIAEAKARLGELVREEKEARELHTRQVAQGFGETVVAKFERGDVPETVIAWFDDALAGTGRGAGSKAARAFLDRFVASSALNGVEAGDRENADSMGPRDATPAMDEASDHSRA